MNLNFLSLIGGDDAVHGPNVSARLMASPDLIWTEEIVFALGHEWFTEMVPKE
jgi:hypothetical protein